MTLYKTMFQLWNNIQTTVKTGKNFFPKSKDSEEKKH